MSKSRKRENYKSVNEQVEEALYGKRDTAFASSSSANCVSSSDMFTFGDCVLASSTYYIPKANPALLSACALSACSSDQIMRNTIFMVDSHSSLSSSGDANSANANNNSGPTSFSSSFTSLPFSSSSSLITTTSSTSSILSHSGGISNTANSSSWSTVASLYWATCSVSCCASSSFAPTAYNDMTLSTPIIISPTCATPSSSSAAAASTTNLNANANANDSNNGSTSISSSPTSPSSSSSSSSSEYSFSSLSTMGISSPSLHFSSDSTILSNKSNNNNNNNCSSSISSQHTLANDSAPTPFLHLNGQQQQQHQEKWSPQSDARSISFSSSYSSSSSSSPSSSSHRSFITNIGHMSLDDPFSSSPFRRAAELRTLQSERRKSGTEDFNDAPSS